MRRPAALAAVGAAALMGPPGPRSHAEETPPAGGRWEYRFLWQPLTEAEFNRLGGDGWELAGARAADRGGTEALISKRPKR